MPGGGIGEASQRGDRRTEGACEREQAQGDELQAHAASGGITSVSQGGCDDASEDARYGEQGLGDELPEELRRLENGLMRI